jgi:hypothetical protein
MPMKPDMHIMASECVSMAYFLNPSHQTVSFYEYSVSLLGHGLVNIPLLLPGHGSVNIPLSLLGHARYKVQMAKNTHATIEQLSDASSSMKLVLYQRN